MRLLSFVAPLFLIWIPLAVAVLLLGLAFHFRSPALGIQAGIIVLVLGLYTAIAWGITTRARAKKV